MPIPIRRLPLLVLDEVIKNLSFRQLFILSICSNRMNLVVKNLRDTSIKLNMNLIVRRNPEVYLSSENQEHHPLLVLDIHAMSRIHRRTWRTYKFGGALFKEIPLRLISFLVDVKVGTKSLLEYLSDLFCAPIKEVSIYENRFFWILDMIESMQGPRSYKANMFDELNRLADYEFRHLLVELNPSKIHLRTQPSENFRIRNFNKQYDSFQLSKCNWFTFENLLTMDCNQVQMNHPMFTTAEINRFFRHVLIEGGAPRLTLFAVRVKDGDHNEMLEGIREVLLPIPGGEQFEINVFTWKFRGILNRRNQSVLVSIRGLTIMQPIVCLEIGE